MLGDPKNGAHTSGKAARRSRSDIRADTSFQRYTRPSWNKLYEGLQLVEDIWEEAGCGTDERYRGGTEKRFD